MNHDELLSVLRPADVSAARADRLRRLCHAALVADAPLEREEDALGWGRWLAPALGGAWSAIYVVETLRRAAVMLRW